jgi:hypothetical protein
MHFSGYVFICEKAIEKFGDPLMAVDHIMEPFMETGCCSYELESQHIMMHKDAHIVQVIENEEEWTDVPYRPTFDNIADATKACGKHANIVTRNIFNLYDWYVVGGRWPNRIIMKKGKNQNWGQVKDVDIEAMDRKRQEDIMKHYDDIIERFGRPVAYRSFAQLRNEVDTKDRNELMELYRKEKEEYLKGDYLDPNAPYIAEPRYFELLRQPREIAEQMVKIYIDAPAFYIYKGIIVDNTVGPFSNSEDYVSFLRKYQFYRNRLHDNDYIVSVDIHQ